MMNRETHTERCSKGDLSAEELGVSQADLDYEDRKYTNIDKKLDLVPVNNQPEYRTKDNQLIQIKVAENAIESAEDRGWVKHKLIAYINKQAVGAISMGYIPREKFEEHYPSIWHYLQKIEGRYLGVDVDKQKEIIKYISGLCNLRGDSSTKKACAIIKRIKTGAQHEFKEFESVYVDRPYVTWIGVHPRHQGKGIAFALYESAARWIAEKGFALHKGGREIDPKVLHIWNAMAERPEYPTGYEDRLDLQGRQIIFLDYS